VVFNKVDDQLKMVGASEAGSTACVCFLRKEGSNKLLIKNQINKRTWLRMLLIWEIQEPY